MLSRRGLFGFFAGAAALGPAAVKGLGGPANAMHGVDLAVAKDLTGFAVIRGDQMINGSVTADLLDIGPNIYRSGLYEPAFRLDIDQSGIVRGIIWREDVEKRALVEPIDIDNAGCA